MIRYLEFGADGELLHVCTTEGEAEPEVLAQLQSRIDRGDKVMLVDSNTEAPQIDRHYIDNKGKLKKRTDAEYTAFVKAKYPQLPPPAQAPQA